MTNPPPFDDFVPAGGGRLTAVLGPTNTGKTHYALERMMAHKSGMIGLPLRLLAREIYDRILEKKPAHDVALVTGEEKIIPNKARYWVATVEAMPLERDVDFLAIDEIQLAADPERGRIFTSRLLHARGKSETLLLGADTMRPILQRLFRDIQFLSRDRLSRLTYSGPKKVTRLPRRSAVVCFSSDNVYAIAELIRRQRGGAAVVLGALSPRTRNAQAELYQSGEVDYLVATDAIGMGLNMDIDHVAFAAQRKFDGRRTRNLTHSEMAQIAGRAGRHIRDGTFGVTAECRPLDDDIVLAIEDHQFDPVKALQWRSEQIDLSSLPALRNSLDRPAPRPEFVRSRREDDEDALLRLTRNPDVSDLIGGGGGAALATLWDICQVPDFRKMGAEPHARLLAEIYTMLMRDDRVNNDWLAKQINRIDRLDGDIDTLSARISHIRTWTYLSHRSAWIENAAYWQERARAIEDSLSDALHEKLTQRFVDRRTAALLKRLKDDAPLLAGVTDDGEVIVEGQFVGRLLGFEFILDPRASGVEAKSLRAAADKALRPVLAARAAALANASADELSLKDDGAVFWRSAKVGQLQKGAAPLRPNVAIIGLSEITPNMRARVEDRIKDFVTAKIEGLLSPLISLQNNANDESDAGLKGLSKGVAFRLVENFGATSRSQFGDDLKQIDQTERGKLRKAGMRFGEYTLFLPALLKPAPAHLLTMLWALWNDRKPNEIEAPKAGLVSIEMSKDLPHAFYYASGYRPSGTRAVRIDMLERLAGLIRTARNEADMREGFAATSQMMSLVGCSGEDFEGILRSLGLRKHMVKKKPAPVQAEASPTSIEPTPEAPTGETTPATKPEPTTAAEQTAEPSAELTPSVEPAAPAANDETPSVEVVATEPAPVEQAISGDATDPKDEPASEPTAAASNASADAPEGAPEGASEGSTVETASSAPEEEQEIALWRPAPRKPRRDYKANAKQGQQRDGKPGQRKGQRPGQKSGRPGAKGKPRRDNKPKTYSTEPRQNQRNKKADPNSPFAVLAGLKSELSGKPQDAKSKETEKAD